MGDSIDFDSWLREQPQELQLECVTGGHAETWEVQLARRAWLHVTQQWMVKVNALRNQLASQNVIEMARSQAEQSADGGDHTAEIQRLTAERDAALAARDSARAEADEAHAKALAAENACKEAAGRAKNAIMTLKRKTGAIPSRYPNKRERVRSVP